MRHPLAAGLAAALFAAAVSTAMAAQKVTAVRMSVDEDPIVLRLAESLGYFGEEGIELVRVDLDKLMPHDYLMQEPLAKGQIDAAYHWFSHTVYGARHGFPVKAVMLFNDAPGMKVMVADRVKGEIRGAADFRGRRIAEGAGYGTKSVINGYMAQRAGLPAYSYTPVMLEKKGRGEAVLQGLKDGAVDVMTFEEPISSSLLATHLATTLYDMSSGEATAKVLGAPFPAQSLLMSPRYIEEHPDTVQHLVNALVKSMRFINSHGAEEIAARLPADYFSGKDRAAEVRLIRDTLPTYARGDYAFSPAAVALAADINLSSGFDKSEEGRWRASGDKSKVRAEALYDNRFVRTAMNAIPAFRLSELPAYQPGQQVSGTIRNYGFGLGGVLKLWEDGFRRIHPGVTFDDKLPTSDAAIPALVTGVTDLAPDGGEPAITEALSFFEVYGYHPTDVIVASGAFDVEGKSNGPVVFVHRDNPITQLSMEQLDGIFGAERTAGMQNGFKWDPAQGRGSEKDIRTWGQLGLKGEWAEKPIQTYGHAPSGTTRFFQWKVMGNGDKWNPNYREYVESGSKMIADSDKATQRLGLQHMLREELSKNRYGIAWTVMPQAKGVEGVKPIAVVPRGSDRAIVPSMESFQNRSYPMVRNIYIYLNRKPGTPVEPKLREFLRYILSREGQQIVADNASYLPLTGALAAEQLRKLD